MQNKKLFFFYNREMTRRVLPSSAYADIPNAKIMGGDFSPFLLNTNMTYAPQFKTGTVFQPGTIKRDGAGNIIGGVPFANNVVPQSMWQPLSANMLKIYTGIPGYANLPAAPNPGYVRYFYNNPSRLWKNQDLLRVDYAINSKMNTFFRWVNDYQKEQNENGIWTGEPFPIQPQDASEAGQLLVMEPGEYVHARRSPPRPSCPTITNRSRSRSLATIRSIGISLARHSPSFIRMPT